MRYRACDMSERDETQGLATQPLDLRQHRTALPPAALAHDAVPLDHTAKAREQ
jgi:hypothetical protein